MGESTSLYRHLDTTGALLYVGISCHVTIRTSQHEDDAKWFHEIKTISVEHFSDRKSASKAEKSAIKNEKPKYNRQYNNQKAARNGYAVLHFALPIELYLPLQNEAKDTNRSIVDMFRHILKERYQEKVNHENP